MSWLLYFLACAWLLAAIRARRKAAALHVLEPSADPISSDHLFYTSPGVTIDETHKRAASAHARRHEVEFLDLIPQQARALDVFGLLHLIDPRVRDRDPLRSHFPTGYAVLVSKRIRDRCAFPSSSATLPEFFATAKLLARHASGSTDSAVVPDWAPGHSKRIDWTDLAALLGGAPWFAIWIQFIEVVLIIAGLILSTNAGLIALLSYHMQPTIALAGGPLRPSGLVKSALFRLVLEFLKLVHLLSSRPAESARLREVESRRASYQAMEARGLNSFFEPRREDCPLCGAGGLETVVRTTDLLQGKPGTFVLERCPACGLVFQNPRLSELGLAYYYGDFYDGLGGAEVDHVLSTGRENYLRRARMITGILDPAKWLDVGAGYSHFCAIARQVWPDASFDGLDMSECVFEGLRFGWLDEAIRGKLPDVAPSIAGKYDVVSMFHYFEHTVEPREELRACYEVLRPGGCLLMEVPNPECPMGRWLGKFWICWFQPQHLHMVTLPAIEQLLVEAGFEPVKFDVTNTYIEADFMMASWLLRRWAGGWLELPWRPAPTVFGRFRYGVVSALWAPAMLVGFALDKLTAPLFRRAGITNAYRVAALKPSAAGD